MKPRNVVVMLLLVLACAAAFFLLKEGGNGTAARLPAVMPQFEKADVTAISLQGPADKLSLRRREGSTDLWDALVGTELVRADANAVDELISALSRQSVREKIERSTLTDADVAGYELDKPVIVAEMTVAEKPLTVRFGKLSREGGKVYIDTGTGTDVWIVSKDALELAISAVSSGLKDRRLFDSTLFDVAKLEIVKGGVTAAEVVRDLSQDWHMAQPFKGYAHPGKFETELNRIVNVEIGKWIEFGAPDLEKYGLGTPAFEVRITPKGEGKKPEVLLVGAASDEGVFVMEAGTRSVASVGRRFFEAVSLDPLQYRDRSFTRLGRDGAAVSVQVGDVHYRLEKAGSSWDVAVGAEGTERHPADGARVEKLLDRLREWQSVEFLDAQKPEDVGITGKDFVEITRNPAGREAPGKIVLLLAGDPARRPDADSVYAQRKDDGGVERVAAGPLDEMLLGAHQYFRASVAEIPTDAIDEIERTKGRGSEGEKVQAFRTRRDLGGIDKSWQWDSGNTGQPDGQVISDILAALRSVTTPEWLTYAAEKDGERMGFKPADETLTMTVHLANMAGIEPSSTIHVGRRREEGGGHFARLVGKDQAGSWAFVMPDDVVLALSKALSKD